MIDKIQKDMLMLLGNEETRLPLKSRHGYTLIIAELDRIRMGIRYHEYKGDCPCQPETRIKEIINEDNKLKKFLEEEKLLEGIYMIVYIETINSQKTVFDLDEKEVEEVIREERSQ